MPEINGLSPTRTRLALLRAINEGGGRIYCEAGVVRDRLTYWGHTDRIRQMIAADWIRALAPGEPRGPGETAAPGVTFYRLKEFGLVALAEDKGKRNG